MKRPRHPGGACLRKSHAARDYPKHPALGALRVLVGSGGVAPTTRLRRSRGVLLATLVMRVLLGGAMIIWYEMAVLPHAGQRLAQEGHSRSHAPQTLAC
ncbi:MAG TPA: hypothetical protein VIY90_11955 [Steroidobacteraceae bacterium]